MFLPHDYKNLLAWGEERGVRFRHCRGTGGTVTTIVHYQHPEKRILIFAFSVWRPDPDDSADIYIRKEQNYYALLRLRNSPYYIHDGKRWGARRRSQEVRRAVCNPELRFIYIQPAIADRFDGTETTHVEADAPSRSLLSRAIHRLAGVFL